MPSRKTMTPRQIAIRRIIEKNPNIPIYKVAKSMNLSIMQVENAIASFPDVGENNRCLVIVDFKKLL